MEDPAIEGPDYVALVIEWDDIDDLGGELEELGDPVTIVREAPRDRARTVATVLGALGVFALAAWGLRRMVSA